MTEPKRKIYPSLVTIGDVTIQSDVEDITKLKQIAVELLNEDCVKDYLKVKQLDYSRGGYLD